MPVEMPDLTHDADGILLEDLAELLVSLKSPDDRVAVSRERRSLERGRECADLMDSNVALALLVRIVKRKAMQNGPNELARDVLEAEFERRVLVNRVVTRVERQGADRIALPFGDR